MELTAIFREFAQAAGPAAVAALWQGAVLAAGLGICLRFAPRVAAADRFRAWAAGFVALVALPLLPFLSAIHFGANGAGAEATGSAARAWLDLDPRWALGIAALWIAASAWRATELVVDTLRLRAVWRDAKPIEFAGVKVEVCATSRLDRPSVIGFFRPRILIPAWLLGRLTAAELKQVVLHEAEHLERRDDWTNLLQKLALILFPLNPALAWMERQLCHEREMACDDAVVLATGKPRAYAACLASIAERGLERRREALSLGAWRKRPELVGRVHRILKQAPGLSPAAARALLAVVGGGLVFGLVEFARAPQLVAFVATPVAIAQSNTPDLVNTDGRAMAGFRAVNAMAHMPGRAALAQGAGAAGREHFASAAGRAKDRKGSSQGNSREANNSPLAGVKEGYESAVAQNAAGNDKQQWIVLATWEQVVTVRRSARNFADYDVNETAAASAEQAATGAVIRATKAGTPATTPQWTFTQMILRVDPARESGAADDGSDSDSNSQPAQPAVIPLHDGWLVFQL